MRKLAEQSHRSRNTHDILRDWYSVKCDWDIGSLGHPRRKVKKVYLPQITQGLKDHAKAFETGPMGRH